jgi:hypothetical protein
VLVTNSRDGRRMNRSKSKLVEQSLMPRQPSSSRRGKTDTKSASRSKRRSGSGSKASRLRKVPKTTGRYRRNGGLVRGRVHERRMAAMRVFMYCKSQLLTETELELFLGV